MQNREEEKERDTRLLLLSLLNSQSLGSQGSGGGHPLVGLNHPSLLGGGFSSMSPYYASVNNNNNNNNNNDSSSRQNIMMHLPGGTNRMEDQFSSLPVTFSGMPPPPSFGLPTTSSLMSLDRSFGGSSAGRPIGRTFGGGQPRMGNESAELGSPYLGGLYVNNNNNNWQSMGLPSGASRIEDQFSTQRLPMSFSSMNPPPGFGWTSLTPTTTTPTTTTPTIPLEGGVRGSGSGTVGMALGDKRRIGENSAAESPLPSSKRRKKGSTIGRNKAKELSPAVPAFTGTALRMPHRLDGGPKVEPLDPQHRADLIDRVLPKHGAFPMPNVRDISSKSRTSGYSLHKFSKLWTETDEETRREVLARRLEQTRVPIPPRNYSDKANKSG